MWPFRNSAGRHLKMRILLAGLPVCFTVVAAPGNAVSLPTIPTGPATRNDQDSGKSTSQPPATIRWDEQQTGCTFSRGEDGKYHYGLWSGDVGITMSVDAREVHVIRHRIEPIFGVLLTIRYRGASGLDFGADGITLQFMKHFKIIQPALDSDSYIQKIQADADAFDDQTRRDIAKHPGEKQRLETRLQDYQKSANELIEFLGKNSLRAAHLDRSNPEVHGWVFFDTRSKWLGGWKTQQQFDLHLPRGGKPF